MDEKKINCCCNEHDLEHQEDCDCHHEHDEDIEYIYLTFDDDSEVKCAILGIFEVEGKEYIALVPEGQECVFIYKYSEGEDGFILDTIEDDDEFQVVSEAFYEIFTERE